MMGKHHGCNFENAFTYILYVEQNQHKIKSYRIVLHFPNKVTSKQIVDFAIHNHSGLFNLVVEKEVGYIPSYFLLVGTALLKF